MRLKAPRATKPESSSVYTLHRMHACFHRGENDAESWGANLVCSISASMGARGRKESGASDNLQIWVREQLTNSAAC